MWNLVKDVWLLFGRLFSLPTKPGLRRVGFPVKDRLVMGTNLGFNVSLLLIVPLLLASIWLPALWWKTLPLLFVLSVACSVLVFWLPGKVGVQKGLSLGFLAAAVCVIAGQTVWVLSGWTTLGWAAWVLGVSAFIGYDMPSWSPLWRQDSKELVLGLKNTHVEIIPEKCISCHLCDIVCPSAVFDYNSESKKYEVVNLAACQACGACIENCPTDAIVNNFREGICSCPTCYVIEGVATLKGKLRGTASEAEPAASSSPPNDFSGCCSGKNEDSRP
jgi:NAD-dependent dihydropyrimidine dehydrogenase PreA subunit